MTPTLHTVTGFTPRKWSWVNQDTQNAVVAVEITAPGIHTFHIWLREDGFNLDQIVLTTDSNFVLVN